MDLNSFVERYAKEINGQYSGYDNEKSVLIVPIDDHRFQTIYARQINLIDSVKFYIEFTSKVCQVSPGFDFKAILEQQSSLVYTHFFIKDAYLLATAKIFPEAETEEMVKLVIQELANTADKWEWKLTGLDIN